MPLPSTPHIPCSPRREGRAAGTAHSSLAAWLVLSPGHWNSQTQRPPGGLLASGYCLSGLRPQQLSKSLEDSERDLLGHR